MLEVPPLLSVKRPARRPTAAQIAAFQDVPTSFVVDAMNGTGTLSSAIRPVGEGRDIDCRAAGPALTVGNGSRVTLAPLSAIAASRLASAWSSAASPAVSTNGRPCVCTRE